MLTKIFLSVLEMSFVAGIVIIAVFILRMFLRKCPKIISYSLWAVVLFRLLCPFSVQTIFSLLPDEVSSGEMLEEITDDYVGAAKIFHDNTEAYDAAVKAGRVPISTGTGSYYVITAADGIYEPHTVADVWLPVCTGVWGLGIAALGGYNIYQFIALKRRLKDATALRDNIYLTGSVSSPFVLGLFHPKIYLPYFLGQEERTYIILHEQYHIRRGDHVLKILAFAALCIHWFNPLVWLAFSLSAKDMEMSCDEAVIRQMGEDIRGQYAASLLSLATGRRFVLGVPLAFGEGDVKDRIYNLSRWKKPAMVVTVLSVAICFIAAICLMTDPVKEVGELGGAGKENRPGTEHGGESLPKEANDRENTADTENGQESENKISLDGQGTETEFLAQFEAPDTGVLAGYTAAQSEAIREELYRCIVYEEPDEYGMTIWLDTSDTEKYQVSLFFHNDFNREQYQFAGLNLDSIEALQMDGNSWLHVTGKALFEQDGSIYYYKNNVLDIMIPVTVQANASVTLGKVDAKIKSENSLNSDWDILTEMGYTLKQLHMEKADVTHDGVADYIVTDMYFPPEAQVTDKNLEEMVQQYLWPSAAFVSVYDGTTVQDGVLNAPIWRQEYSAAHAGNGQLCIVYRDGLAYLLTSGLWQGQGFVGYGFEVLALDSLGREYIIAEGNTQFEDKKITRDEQRELITEFKNHITPWFEDAVLIIATEVEIEEQFITTQKQRFAPQQYYDIKWAQWED